MTHDKKFSPQDIHVDKELFEVPEIDVEYGEDGSIVFVEEGLTLRPRPGAGPLMQLPDEPSGGSGVSLDTPSGIRVRVNGRLVIAALSAALTLWLTIRR